MDKKYVKDGAHNRYPAYCCDDIDARVGALEEAVAALVAGTVPDGSVTLAKLAEDARTHTREINKGRLISEWIGTKEEYEAHLAENGGEPLPNVRYSLDSLAWENVEIKSWHDGEKGGRFYTDLELQAGAVYIFNLRISMGSYEHIAAAVMLTADADAGGNFISTSNFVLLPYVEMVSEDPIEFGIKFDRAYLLYSHTTAEKSLAITTEDGKFNYKAAGFKISVARIA